MLAAYFPFFGSAELFVILLCHVNAALPYGGRGEGRAGAAPASTQGDILLPAEQKKEVCPET